MAGYKIRYVDKVTGMAMQRTVYGKERRDITIGRLLEYPESIVDSIRCWTLNIDGSVRANSAVKEWRC